MEDIKDAPVREQDEFENSILFFAETDNNEHTVVISSPNSNSRILLDEIGVRCLVDALTRQIQEWTEQ